MVSKCANPECEVPFRYFRLGKLFRLETQSGHDRRRQMGVEDGVKKPLRHIEFFWLCNECAARMTLVSDKEIGVHVHPQLAAGASA